MNMQHQTTNPVRKPAADDVDITRYLFIFLENWYWFVLAVFLGLGGAYIANRYTIKIYKVNASLLMEDGNGRYGYYMPAGFPEGSNVFSGFGLLPGLKSMQNQIIILQSYRQISTTVHNVDFEVSYFKDEVFGRREIYREAPFVVSFDRSRPQPLGILFEVKMLDNGRFHITGSLGNGKVDFYDYLQEKVTASSSSFEVNTEAAFGEPVNGEHFFFTLIPREGMKSNGTNTTGVYYFRFNSYESLINEWMGMLKLMPMKNDASIVELSVNTDCPEKARVFLDSHLNMYLQRLLDKKNQVAQKTIDFIDRQLLSIADSLGKKEMRLQDFRRSNQVVDLSFQAQQLFEQAREIENGKAELKLKGDYYQYLKSYLRENRDAGNLIAPSLMGIDDPLLNNLVLELNRMESQKIAMTGSGSSRNPYLTTLESQIKNARATFEETLMNLEKNNNIAIADIDRRLEKVMAEVRKLPQTERELFNIERDFKINDDLYTFLLQRRSEAQIAKASNTPDNEVIDYARVSGGPIKPKKMVNYLIGLILGFGIPGLFFTVKEALNTRVETEDEVKKITGLPVAGHISHSVKDYQTVVLEDPHSNVAEAFRNLRTRMRFFTKEIKNPVILITSSMPAEGKTFTALNLASAYSLVGQKAVLVSFDLRRPRLFSEFGIDNEEGITTYLIGKDNIDDVIKETGHENLYVIPAGPVPPNPAELSASVRVRELFEELRKRFDVIVVDSAPIGTVSDTYSLAPLADAVVLVVRHNRTVKQLLHDTIEDCRVNGINGMSVLMNDIRSEMRSYGYRGRYGYSYGYGYYYGREGKGGQT